ncbi:MAG: DUF805 domain-containing protein [Candidatus Microsaccharimonas sp.]
MTFLESIQAVPRKYAEFSGRASRSEFWWWILFTVLVTSAFNVFSVITVGQDGSIGSILSGLWGVVILLPTLAVTVRRLRDAGYAWTNVFWILLPFAGLIILAIYLSNPQAKKK